MNKINLGIIGAGNIAIEHLKVIKKIKDLNPYGINSKTNKNCLFLSKKFNINKIFNSYIELVTNKNIDAVLLLVSAEETYKILLKIIEYKKPIFVEKPPCLSINELNYLIIKNKKYKTLNMVGFNRRFYSIFHKGLKIASRGKVLGITIEGHERFWKIKDRMNKKLINKWIYANSSHTIDLIRFFGGEIKKIYSLHTVKNNKKKLTSILETNRNIHCCYFSYWDTPGGWSVKIFGDNFQIVYQPLEQGFWIDKNFKKHQIKAAKHDIINKPGFYLQMKAFKKLITNKKLFFPAQSIEDTMKTFKIIAKIN